MEWNAVCRHRRFFSFAKPLSFLLPLLPPLFSVIGLPWTIRLPFSFLFPHFPSTMLSLRLKTVASRRALSTQARSVLSSLNIPTDGSDIPGVFNTRWTGSGESLSHRLMAKLRLNEALAIRTYSTIYRCSDGRSTWKR